jgi:hypothetical protein
MKFSSMRSSSPSPSLAVLGTVMPSPIFQFPSPSLSNADPTAAFTSGTRSRNSTVYPQKISRCTRSRRYRWWWGLTEVTKSTTFVLSSPPFPIAPALMLAMSSGKLLRHTDLSDESASFNSFSLRPARRHIESSQRVSNSDSEVYVDKARNVCLCRLRLMEVLSEDRVDLNSDMSGVMRELNVVATRDDEEIGARSDSRLYSS